jgi:hypothetical protein
MDNELNPIRRLAPGRRSRPIRRLLMDVTGLAAVIELFDLAVVELFEEEPDQAAV